VQATYYGKVHHAASSSDPEDDQIYSPKTSIDLHFTHHFNGNIPWTLGVNNLFDQYPDEQNPNLVSGALWRSVQMGINGRFLYLRHQCSLIFRTRGINRATKASIIDTNDFLVIIAL
jgi:iron complex outermembrane receptor protein